MKNYIYKFGCTLGWFSLSAAFFINLTNVNLLGLSFFIFGITFLYNFYLNNGKFDLINCWWQDIYGIFCVFIALYLQLGLGKYNLGIILTIFFMICIVLKYNYTKKKLKEKNQGLPKFPFTNLN